MPSHRLPALVLVSAVLLAGCSTPLSSNAATTQEPAGGEPPTGTAALDTTTSQATPRTATPAQTRTPIATLSPTPTCTYDAGYLLSAYEADEGTVDPENATDYRNLTASQRETFRELRSGHVKDRAVENVSVYAPLQYNGTYYVVERSGAWDECT